MEATRGAGESGFVAVDEFELSSSLEKCPHMEDFDGMNGAFPPEANPNPTTPSTTPSTTVPTEPPNGIIKTDAKKYYWTRNKLLLKNPQLLPNLCETW